MDRNEIRKSIEEKAEFSFARSGGKGGQNVNKVNTKVHIAISPDEISGLTDSEKSRVKTKLSSIINSDGKIFLDADDERFQGENRRIALERLVNKIASAAVLPKKRVKTKPTRTSVERRLKMKKIKSERKKMRRNGALPD